MPEKKKKNPQYLTLVVFYMVKIHRNYGFMLNHASKMFVGPDWTIWEGSQETSALYHSCVDTIGTYSTLNSAQRHSSQFV